MVIWLIGLSASGKTTLGSALYRVLKEDNPAAVFLDGDMVRAVTANDLDHSVDGRRRNAKRIRNLCLQLDKQGLAVVCAILSIFPESSAWNREHISDYREIYVEASMDTVRRRDSKGLYSAADAGRMDNVVGVDIPFPEPESPDLVINNDTDNANPEALARDALSRLGLARPSYRYTKRGLLAEPEKYEYSQYLGTGFLDAYSCNREQALASLEEKISKLPLAAFAPTPPHPLLPILDGPDQLSAALWAECTAEQPATNSPDHLDTRAWLLSALGKNNGAYPDELATLLRRFEVSKKIRTVYGPGFTKFPDSAGAHHDNLALYGLFGLALALAARSAPDPKRLAFINGLLKTGDILVSESARLASPLELYASRAALLAERELAAPFLSPHGGHQ